MGAPQLGHFSDVTPEGATTAAPLEASVGLTTFIPVPVPHLTQNAASSGSWVPHLWQYTLMHLVWISWQCFARIKIFVDYIKNAYKNAMQSVDSKRVRRQAVSFSLQATSSV
jgi:DNA primase